MKLDKRIIEEFENKKKNSVKPTDNQLKQEIIKAIINGDCKREEVLLQQYELNLNKLDYGLDPKYENY